MAEKSTRRRGVLIPLLLVVALAAVAADVFPIRQIISQGRDLERSQTRLEEIREENRRLEQQIQELQTPAGIERIARADFGYVRPGDISYVVIAEDEGAAAGRLAQAQGADPESGGFLQALWDYLTGRDLVDE